MDGQQFLAEFGHFANSPNGVGKLRELVLRLAMQGGLVEQSPSDEPVSEFLSRMPVPDKKVQRRSRAARGGHDGILRSLPFGWEAVQLHRIAFPQAGFAFKANLFNQNKQGPPIIRVRDVGANSPQTYFSGEYRDEFLVDRDDWLVAMDGDFRVAKWEAGQALLNQRVSRLRFFSDEIEKKYVAIALQFELRKLQGVKNYTTVDHLSGSQISDAVISLPPVAEQARIVAKVEEMMALFDRLEQQQQSRRKLQNGLRYSTLQAVANAHSQRELEESWQRLETSFSKLSSAPGDVDDFVVELKSLAVRGLLVSSSLLKPDLDRIKNDRTTLKDSYIAKKMMRTQKTVGMAERDTLYPGHWAITAFDDVAIVIGGVTKGRNLRDRQTITCPYLAVANVQRGYLKLDRLKSIEITTDELEKYVVVEGDLLITEGGDWDKVGRTAIWRGEIENCLHQNHVFKARVPSDLVLNEWVELVFNSGVGRDYFAGASKQTTNLASINMTQLRSFPMPIPPVDEQKRILETLSSLTKLCEDWRSLLEDRQELSASFANAAIASLTGIATDQKEEAPVKAPQTELIAPLRLGTTPDVTAQAPLTTILARHKGELPARDLWQRFGGEIDAFYAQLKTEVAHGWIAEPAVAEMLEKPAEAAGA